MMFASVPSRLRRDVLLSMVLTIATILLGRVELPAQQPKPSEYQVKAAYLYNFGRFVKWPARVSEGDGGFAICVIGQDPFGPALDSTLTGKVLDGKPVVTRRISKPQDAANCRIVFIDATQDQHLQEILGALDRTSVLTVSDLPNFSQRGGMIQFVLEENRVRFEVNLASAQSAGLTLSSELLKVALSVNGNGRPGE